MLYGFLQIPDRPEFSSQSLPDGGSLTRSDCRRRRRTLSQALVLGVAAVAILVSPSTAGPLAFTSIDVPGAMGTIAIGTNDNGRIVGAYAGTDSPQCVATLIGCHGFLLDNGVFTQIDFPGAKTTFAQGINDRGQIVGQFLDGAGVNRGFLLDKGVFAQIDVPGAVVTGANSIDDRGRILGIFDDGPDPFLSRHGFLLDAGAFIPIDFPGSMSTSHVGFNDNGQIVGVFLDAGVAFHGFLLDRGIFMSFDFPGALDTSAEGINDRGQIVGQFFVARPGLPRGFFLEGGVFTALNAPGSISTIADDINDSGWIVGQFQNASGAYHGFLATPVPEPSTLVLLTFGVLTGLVRSRRRKKLRENHDSHLYGSQLALRGIERIR